MKTWQCGEINTDTTFSTAPVCAAFNRQNLRQLSRANMKESYSTRACHYYVTYCQESKRLCQPCRGPGCQEVAEVSHASRGWLRMAGHLKYMYCRCCPSLLPDVLMHGISTISLDDLEPFLRSAETQARAYALFCRPEYLLVWGPKVKSLR